MKVRLEDVEYPYQEIEYQELSDLDLMGEGLNISLVLTLDPEETRRVLATIEAAPHDRYSNGGSAHIKASIDISHYFYRNRNIGREGTPYYTTHLDGCVWDIRRGTYVEIYEPAPDEWVSFTYHPYSPTAGYWSVDVKQQQHNNA